MRRALAVAALAGVLLAPASPVLADAVPTDDDPTELLERYAPVLALRRQSSPCEEGEPYHPIAVDHVLGRDDVVLRDGDGEVVTAAPTAVDLAGGGADWELDLPGDALDPGCDYEQWFRSMDADPAVYARAVVDGDVLVAQYWLYYVYNDWNDRHESDWEMIQLLFDTTSVAEALEQGPDLYAYAQHEGSEYAFPDDAVELAGATETEQGKVRLIDGAPVVYAGEGSHAAYFDRSRWFGSSGATGFGCDDTTAPLVELRPEVIVIPADAPPDGELAWLAYEGHWGERRPMFNDGPTGPAMKDQWLEPVEWVDDEGRDAAVPVPFGGSPSTDAFCDVSRNASMALLRLLDHPVRFALIAAAVVVALALVVRCSSRGVLRAAARSYRRHPARLLQIGGAIVFAGALSLALHWLVVRFTSVGDVLDVLGDESPWAVPFLAAVAAVVTLPVMAWVLAATVELAVGRDGSRPGSRWWPRAALGTFLTALLLVLAVGVAALIVLAVPLAVVVAAWWLLAPVVCADERVPATGGLRGSSQLLAGHRLRAVGLVVTSALILATSGVVGAALLALGVGFAVASVVVTLWAVVLVPYIALVLTSFHAELVAGRTDSASVSGPGGRAVGELVDGVDPAGDAAGVIGGAGQQ